MAEESTAARPPIEFVCSSPTPVPNRPSSRQYHPIHAHCHSEDAKAAEESTNYACTYRVFVFPAHARPS